LRCTNYTEPKPEPEPEPESEPESEPEPEPLIVELRVIPTTLISDLLYHLSTSSFFSFGFLLPPEETISSAFGLDRQWLDVTFVDSDDVGVAKVIDWQGTRETAIILPDTPLSNIVDYARFVSMF
jgi:hypothetical protein